MKFCPLHVFEKILSALHEDDPLERRVFAHDSAAAVSSYDELTQSNIILPLDKFNLNLQLLYQEPFFFFNNLNFLLRQHEKNNSDWPAITLSL